MIHAIERVVDLVRVLEDHLDVAQEGASIVAGQLLQVVPFIQDLTAGGGDQAKQQAGERGLTATAFADDRGHAGWGALDGERKIIKRDGDALVEQAAAEDLGCLACFEQCAHATSMLAPVLAAFAPFASVVAASYR